MFIVLGVLVYTKCCVMDCIPLSQNEGPSLSCLQVKYRNILKFWVFILNIKF